MSYTDLRSALGNQAIQRMLRSDARSSGFTLSQPGDPYERDADRAVSAVLHRQLAPSAVLNRTHTPASVASHRTPFPDLGAGQPLDGPLRAFFEPRYGHDFSGVRVHTGEQAAGAARELEARAFTAGQQIVFGAGEYAPQTEAGQRLLAHELAHVVQQSDGAGGTTPAVQRQGAMCIQDAGALTEYAPFGGGVVQGQDAMCVPDARPMTPYAPPLSLGAVYRPGDVNGANILLRIERGLGGGVTFTWYNFAKGREESGAPLDWIRMRPTLAGDTSWIADLAPQLTPAQWQAQRADMVPMLLKMHEERRIDLSDATVMNVYRGMIYAEAQRSLDTNEQAIDELLNAPDRVNRIKEYTEGLREASVVRDAMVTRRDELRHSLVQQHSFTFGLAGNLINQDPFRRMRLLQELDPVEQALTFWYQSFPLLTRLQTSEIHPETVEATLRGIKANIVSTREELNEALEGRGTLDLWDLQVVRARLSGSLGPRASQVIADEDTRRRQVAIAKAAGLLVLGIALLFLPGGVFIDAAIGIAMAAKAWQEAIVFGRAANTGLHVDDGLMSQGQYQMALLGATLATIGAVIGAGAVSFRVLRVGRAFYAVRQVAPELELASQMRLARLVASNRSLVSTLRTSAEMELFLRRAGFSATFEEMQALRAVAYHARGIEMPVYSRESLDAFLENVWANRARLLPAGELGVYRLYSAATEANALTRPSREYLEEIASIAEGRPAGAISVTQGSRRLPSRPILELAREGRLYSGAYDRTFFHYVRAGVRASNVQERIYINVAADSATGLMRRVVREIVDNPAEFEGVVEAKLVGPGGVSGRADTILIYAEDQAAVARVMQRIRAYRQANPSEFMTSTPPMTNRVMEGVGVASEPVQVAGQPLRSFGQSRTGAIFDALQASVRAGETQEQFVARVLALMRERGISPEAPHLNLPAGGTP